MAADERTAAPDAALGDDPEALLAWWFGPPSPDGTIPDARTAFWFAGGAAADVECRARAGALLERAIAGALDAWAASPRSRLALVVLLDQISRNVFRGTARAFAQDPRALALGLEALARGDERALAPVERLFLYLPLEHAEDAAAQEESVRRFEALAAEAPEAARAAFETFAHHAREHRDCIRRFGRFPQRNAVLGRTPTPDEAAFLSGPGAPGSVSPRGA